MSRLTLLAILFALTSLVSYGGWALHGRPQAMPDVPDGKLQCVSYAPYREGQSPFQKQLVIPPEQIDEDLRILSERFQCIRTYSVAQGMAVVPRVAARYGIKVMLGVWIGRDDNTGINEKEIALAVQVANDPANKDVISAIIVGNEVLLRREFTAPQLIDWIKKVRTQVSTPVTYADVWEFWMKYPSVAEAVDFLTIHILPYWEDDPVGLSGAISHMRAILVKMKAAFPGRNLFIGETGWPSAGRSREAAVPSRANQARYIRDFALAIGEQEGINYNVIESFDQPWKRILEGTVGGHWGIFDTDRQQKFPLRGPVSDNPQWRIDALTGIVIALVLLLSLVAARHAFGLWGWLAAVTAAQAAGAILVRQWLFTAQTSNNIEQWGVNVAGLGLSVMAAVFLLSVIADYASGRAGGGVRPASIAATLDWLRRPRIGRFDRALTLGLLQTLTLFGATSIALQLLFDPRYRDFPTAAFLVPAVGFALLSWLQDRRLADGAQRIANSVEERWLACLLALSAIITGIREGFENWESLGWMATALIIALPWLKLTWVAYRAARRAATRTGRVSAEEA